MTNSQKVNFVICGAFGYMGSSGMNGLKDLVPILERRGVVANLLALIDVGMSPVDQDKQVDAARKMNALRSFCVDNFSVAPVFCSELAEFGNIVEMIKRDGDVNYPIVVYDATPVSVHWELMLYVQRLRDDGVNIHYFGEKPLFTDPQQLVAAKAYAESGSDFFCDFIETRNLTTLAIKAFLDSSPDFLPEELWFWRAGCSGIKKFIDADRPGVAGGAHMDKMPHDLSITVSLLGVENIEKWEVKNASVDLVCLGGHASSEKVDSVLSSSNTWMADLEFDLEQRHRLPADAFSSFDVVWTLKDGRELLAHYISSWIGVVSAIGGKLSIPEPEAKMIEKLESLGFTSAEWLNSHAVQGPIKEWGSPPEYKGTVGSDWTHELMEHQARLAIIKCGEKHLVANFYHKDRKRKNREGNDLAGRWLYLYDSQKQKRKNYTIYEDVDRDRQRNYVDVKGNDFTRVLTSVCEAVLDIDNFTDIGSSGALVVHGVLLGAYDAMMNELASRSECTVGSTINKVSAIYSACVKDRDDCA